MIVECEKFTCPTSNLLLHRTTMMPEGELCAGIVLVHGLGDHLGRYLGSLDSLVDAGVLITGVDFPGHGRSDGRRGHFASEDWLHASIRESILWVKEKLAGYGHVPLGIIGHSMGGLVCLDFLAKNRNSVGIDFFWLSSALIDPSLGQPTPLIWTVRLLHHLLPKWTIDTGIKTAELYRDAVADRKSDLLAHKRLSLRGAAVLFSLSRSFQKSCRSGWNPDFDLFITHDPEDKICPFEPVKRLYSDNGFGSATRRKMTLLTIPNGYHEPWRQREVVKRFEEWLFSLISEEIPK